jgi:hypothetical protein
MEKDNLEDLWRDYETRPKQVYKAQFVTDDDDDDCSALPGADLSRRRTE